jgi:PAS domain S-box-containing protein
MMGECIGLSDQILERIDDGIFVLDRDWRFIYLNKRAASIFGKDPRDFLGKTIWETNPELLGTPMEAACRSAMERGEASNFEMKGADADIWFEIAVTPMSSGIMVHGRDITERHEEVRALRERETRDRGLFENLHEGVSVSRYILDEWGEVTDWELIDANTWIERLLERRRCSLIGMRVSQLYGDHGIPDALLSAVREMRRTNSSVSIESYRDPLVDKDFHVSFLPQSDGSFYVLTIDVTRLKNAQSRAEEDRARLQAILDSTPVAMGITDINGGVLLDNGALSKIWCGDLSLKNVRDYSKCRAWWPESGEPVRPEEWPAAQALKGRTSTETFDIEKFDGTRGALIVSASPIRDQGGAIIGAAWTVQDVSDIKRTEEELKRSNADLQQYAYVASHDLQEPLRMVMGHLELLMKRHGDDIGPDAADYISSAIEGAKRMRHLIDDLLAYSRIESKGEGMTLVDLNEVVSNALSNLQASIEEAGGQVDIEPLPTVHADGAQMLQVFQNIIGNAIKFRGQDPPRVTVSVRRRSGSWLFCVKDNGIGIDLKHQDDLFKMFHRLHGSDKYPGTGIGLAISKKIVERHGGRIWFESQPGKGTTFFFTVRG